MDVTKLPFNRFIGLEAAKPDSGFLVSLPDDPRYSNHVGTVHAAALLAVAEAGSAVFLLQQLGDQDGFLPIVRRLDAKFRRPALGSVLARANVDPTEVARWRDELNGRGRASAEVPMEVVDASGTVVLAATVEWFIRRQNGASPQAEV